MLHETTAAQNSKTTKKPTKPRKVAPTVAPVPDVVQSPTEAPLVTENQFETFLLQSEREITAKWAKIREQQQAEIGKRLEQLAARKSAESNAYVIALLDRFLGNDGYEPPAQDLDFEIPEYTQLQMVLPFALTLAKNVIKPIDLYGDYELTGIMDYMRDEIPEMLDLVDEVVLIEYFNANGSSWAAVNEKGLPHSIKPAAIVEAAGD